MVSFFSRKGKKFRGSSLSDLFVIFLQLELLDFGWIRKSEFNLYSIFSFSLFSLFTISIDLLFELNVKLIKVDVSGLIVTDLMVRLLNIRWGIMEKMGV